jgi:hypothetical protein
MTSFLGSQDQTWFGSLRATGGSSYGVDWLAWIADQARADELFRRDLDRHSAPDESTAGQRELTSAAARLIQSSPLSGYLTARAHERPSARHVATFGVFGPPDAVVCVTDFPPQVETRDGKAVLLAAGKKITVPIGALPALRPLLSGRPANVHDITTATGVDSTPLADVLIAEGICAEVTPDLARGYAGMLAPEPA